MNIIIGGTHGLGFELARQLRSKGKSAFVIGRSYDELAHGGGMKADLGVGADVDQICKYIQANDIEGFYWVAGYGYLGDFADQNDVRQMGEINFSAVLPIAQTAWKKLSVVRDGKFVVVSSTSGVKARDTEAVYAATKHAQVGFTRSLGLEAERLNLPIKITLILPGGMQTPFWDEGRPSSFSEYLDPVKVASEILREVDGQITFYRERLIERGSL